MKTRDRANPLEKKIDDPNDEPWLNELEFCFEILALQNGINRLGGMVIYGD